MMKNREVIGYGVLSIHSLIEINEKVNSLINLKTGWEPLEKVQVLFLEENINTHKVLYTQTMVQYARSEKDTITNNELPFDLIDSESIISSEEYNGMQEELLDFEKGCKGNNDIGGEIQRLINQEGYEAMDKVVMDSLKNDNKKPTNVVVNLDGEKLTESIIEKQESQRSVICPNITCNMHSESKIFNTNPINPNPCKHSILHKKGSTSTPCGEGSCPMCVGILTTRGGRI